MGGGANPMDKEDKKKCDCWVMVDAQLPKVTHPHVHYVTKVENQKSNVYCRLTLCGITFQEMWDKGSIYAAYVKEAHEKDMRCEMRICMRCRYYCDAIVDPEKRELVTSR
jgi:hypothetical protein